MFFSRNKSVNHTFSHDFLAKRTGQQRVHKTYSLHLIESVVFDFQTSYLTVHLIQNFYINIIHFVMTCFVNKNTLKMIYLFYYFHKK